MEDLKNKNAFELLDEAKGIAINEVPAGTQFKVRDLFVGFKWDEVPTGVRKKAGLYFFVWAKTDGSQYLQIDEKATSGQQLYTRR